MLEVLPQAQAAGNKVQQDALLGQGSIFDLEEPAPTAAGGFAPPKQHPPIPARPDERQDLNAMEKETLGLFLSSHPLKELRPALRKRVDCPLADLANKKDGDWVTVGGMIAEAKRIRTKKGEPMMFATLDDLEAQIEILVFNSERGETKLVVQEVEIFDPSSEEVARAREEAAAEPVSRRLSLQVDPEVAATFLEALKEVVAHYPGDHEVFLKVGPRSLVLGPDYRVSPSSACRTQLLELPGVELFAAEAA
jgi:DNA polymerase-3 subunit alpha